MMTSAMHSSSLYIFLILAVYLLISFLSRRFKTILLNGILFTAAILIGFNALTHISVDEMTLLTKPLQFLLTPATICLAVPIYKNRSLIIQYLKVICISLLVGTITCMVSIAVLSFLFKLNSISMISLIPKSVTTAIALGISEELGGMVSLTALSVILTGVFGSIIAHPLCRLLRIRNDISIGLAIGNSSHAVGTAKAFEVNNLQGTFSSLSIVIAGLFSVILAPLIFTVFRLL
mgnify:CR=1 FL=1